MLGGSRHSTVPYWRLGMATRHASTNSRRCTSSRALFKSFSCRMGTSVKQSSTSESSAASMMNVYKRGKFESEREGKCGRIHFGQKCPVRSVDFKRWWLTSPLSGQYSADAPRPPRPFVVDASSDMSAYIFFMTVLSAADKAAAYAICGRRPLCGSTRRSQIAQKTSAHLSSRMDIYDWETLEQTVRDIRDNTLTARSRATYQNSCCRLLA
jgi:hypothetical protein